MPPAPAVFTTTAASTEGTPAGSAADITETKHHISIEPESPESQGIAALAISLGTLRAKLSTYLEAEEVERIEAAYHFGEAAHRGQFRSSGEPYI